MKRVLKSFFLDADKVALLSAYVELIVNVATLILLFL